MASSTLFPKIHRNHMFPRMCIHEPWRNIDVKMWSIWRPGSVRHTSPSPIGNRVPGGTPSVSSPGMRPRSQMDRGRATEKPAPWMRSHAPTFSAISTNVA